MAPIDHVHLRRRLIAWYRRHRRDLPWRHRPTLFRVLVSEFMLQQTRVDQMLPYYRRFMGTFPSLTTLAKAPLSRVVKLWEGLGYYRRAGYLHQTAKILHGKRQVTVDDLRSCPGIGPYTLAAIASIVYDVPMPVVDGNVRRVVSRVLALPYHATSASGKRHIQAALENWIAPRTPGDFNQAIMELGATVCTPVNPLCTICPLQVHCKARRQGKPEQYPKRRGSKARPHHHIAAAVIYRKDSRVLIAQRLPDGLLPNLWEFPGGKQEPGESLSECCRREIQEELGIDIEVGDEFHAVDHAYSHYAVTVHFFHCQYRRGRPRRIGCQDFAWVRPAELTRYPFPRANKSVVEMLTSPAISIAKRSRE